MAAFSDTANKTKQDRIQLHISQTLRATKWLVPKAQLFFLIPSGQETTPTVSFKSYGIEYGELVSVDPFSNVLNERRWRKHSPMQKKQTKKKKTREIKQIRLDNPLPSFMNYNSTLLAVVCGYGPTSCPCCSCSWSACIRLRQCRCTTICTSDGEFRTM